jgi:EAL domain-containing protein (putative c-di-GMP-specific phosphodiesterase class I)/GGDEF domain-containing protein/CBS domain-containing protein
MNYADLRPQLDQILDQARLVTLLQPILDMVEGRISGYEALTRGPSDSPLHAPQALFKVGEYYGKLLQLDVACSEMAFATFAKLRLPGRLFVNLTPGSLLDDAFAPAAILRRLATHGLERRQLVFEITESSPNFDYDELKLAVEKLRAAGLEIAMDDLGEGFSSLRLWSELRPAFVKIDKHFISGIDQDPHKLQFVRSIQQLAEGANAGVIAEGVETRSEQAIIRDLGIRYAQGYLIGRPSPVPARQAPPEVMRCLSEGLVSVFPAARKSGNANATAQRLIIEAPVVTAQTRSEVVLDLMLRNPELHALAVLSEELPVGIIHRPALLDRFINKFGRELFGRKPCSLIMEADPLIVDQTMPIQELSELVVRKGKQSFTQGFIITGGGRYLGLGSGFDLMREVTEMQIVAARYANPLTGLPGNVPIQEHLERLLAGRQPFVTAYFDLDQFKPYNDVYGFRRGDDMIRLLARLLREAGDPALDFIGHIGGDDFVALFQSEDWETRCRALLERFDRERLTLFDAGHVAEGGYRCEDRRGNLEFHVLVTLSIGAVRIDPNHYQHYQQVAQAAAEAKHMAKRIEGSCLFLDQRERPFRLHLAADEMPAGVSR